MGKTSNDNFAPSKLVKSPYSVRSPSFSKLQKTCRAQHGYIVRFSRYASCSIARRTALDGAPNPNQLR